MVDLLREKNPGIKVFSVFDEEFKCYGKVLTNIDCDEICKTADKIENPETGVAYVPSQDSFEKLSVAKTIEKQVYGGIKSQTGFCWGRNTLLNATEWHTCDEVNIAVTPMVLLLGKIHDVNNNKIDSSKFIAFYVPKGTVVQMYSSTLHYTPCQVSDDGFKCVVCLLNGTNTALDFNTDDKTLAAKNKWLIAHVENEAKRKAGAVMGISGENFNIKY